MTVHGLAMGLSGCPVDPSQAIRNMRMTAIDVGTTRGVDELCPSVIERCERWDPQIHIWNFMVGTSLGMPCFRTRPTINTGTRITTCQTCGVGAQYEPSRKLSDIDFVAHASTALSPLNC